MKKRLIALLLGLLLLAMIPAIAGAEEEEAQEKNFACGLNLNWTFDESTGTLTLTGFGDMYNYSYPDDYGVLDLPPWGQYLGEIKTVILPDGILAIGKDAFRNCTKLTSITIPDSLEEIRMNAFKDCTSMKTAVLGSGVKLIGTHAFYGCKALQSVTIPGSTESIEYGAFMNCSAMTSVSIEAGAKSIGERAFDGCAKLTSITIGDGVQHIDDGAFYNTGFWNAQPNGIVYIDHCLIGRKGTYPKNLVIRDGTKIVADLALWGCYEMQSVSIPNSMEYIGNAAFSGCKALTSLTIPNGVKSIGYEAFNNLIKIKSVTIPDSVTTVGYAAFQSCAALETVKLSDSLTRIEERTFKDCSALKAIDIPASVTFIGKEAFRNCAGLKSLTIPDGIKTLSEGAFAGCSGLTSITVPCGLALGAFNYSTSINTVHITEGTGVMPDYTERTYTDTPWYRTEAGSVTVILDEGIRKIGAYTFYNNSKIKSFTIPDSVTTLGEYAFSGCTKLSAITIPDGVTDLGRYTFSGCTGLKSLRLGRGFTQIDRSVFGGCTGLTAIEIPDTVQYLSGFDGCTGLKTVTIPDSVISLGENAFAGCTGLAAISIPDSVNYISNGVFNGCTSLTSIRVPDGVTEIGNSAFSFCTALTSIRLPDGISKIGVHAFYKDTALEYVIFGFNPSYIRVSDWAFYGCTKLSDVYFNCTEEQLKISVSNFDNDLFKNATWHYILEGERPVEATVGYGTGVSYKGTTPYVVAHGLEQTPELVVKDQNGAVIGPLYYDAVFTDNVNPGTAHVVLTFKNGYTGTANGWFKIYLPPTTATTVENVQDGIYLTWKAVDGAKGYVIYRRAWNLVDGGWTDFKRWNNTTETVWTDTKVYAGTRYQYGIKAYFEDPMDNYNLGLVGPLKTTVRITTRVLNSVKPESTSRITVKWTGSALFTGYEVQVATDAKFTQNVKTVKIEKAKTYQTTVKSLKSKTTYYVRVRSYHIFEGMTYYGQWSNVLNCKTK